MGVGLRPTGKPVDKPPNPKAARAVLLPDRNYMPELEYSGIKWKEEDYEQRNEKRVSC